MNIKSLLLGTAAALACVSLAHADPFRDPWESPAIKVTIVGPQLVASNETSIGPQLASNETGLITTNPGGGMKKPTPPSAVQTACRSSFGKKPCIPAPSTAQLAAKPIPPSSIQLAEFPQGGPGKKPNLPGSQFAEFAENGLINETLL